MKNSLMLCGLLALPVILQPVAFAESAAGADQSQIQQAIALIKNHKRKGASDSIGQAIDDVVAAHNSFGTPASAMWTARPVEGKKMQVACVVRVQGGATQQYVFMLSADRKTVVPMTPWAWQFLTGEVTAEGYEQKPFKLRSHL